MELKCSSITFDEDDASTVVGGSIEKPGEFEFIDVNEEYMSDEEKKSRVYSQESKMELKGSSITSNEDDASMDVGESLEEPVGFEFIDVNEEYTSDEEDKSRIYPRKFRKKWKELPEFCSWLKEGNFPKTAYCNKELVADKSMLLKHKSEKKHKKMVAKQQSSSTCLPELSNVIEELDDCAGQTIIESSRIPSLRDNDQSCSPGSSQKWSRKERNSRKANRIMSIMQQKLDVLCPEDNFDIFGKSLATHLRKLEDNVRVHAEKLIYDILYEAELSNVNKDTQIIHASVNGSTAETPNVHAGVSSSTVATPNVNTSISGSSVAIPKLMAQLLCGSTSATPKVHAGVSGSTVATPKSMAQHFQHQSIMLGLSNKR